MKIKAIRGAKDILPKDSRLWRLIEDKAKTLCINYGYQEIRTPILEETRLFIRSIGQASDIVSKEMYSFLDRKKRSLSLRPEATASVVRAYLEHGLDKSLSLAKFFYFGPMFRAERPQAARLRQFHHIGVEAIGSASPYLDAEVISLAVDILQEIQVKDFTLQLNSIGCQKDRQRFKLSLKKALKSKMKFFCPECLRRYKVNLLRIFDCKNVACKKISSQLPSITDSLCAECAEHFLRVRQILDSSDVSYSLNPYLVRGLDYYSKTCFEITHPQLGAQNALGAGGRYDDLVSELGGTKKPAIGFALGVERLISSLGLREVSLDAKTLPCVYIVTIGNQAKQVAFKILQTLRRQGIFCEMDYLDKSLKGQMRQADKLGFRYAAILGEQELNKQVIILRDMLNKTQKQIKINKLIEELR